MAEEDSFLALVHHDGEIKHKLRKGVKFTDKNSTNVFITTRTRLEDLQRSIQRRLYRDRRKQVWTTELFVEMLDPLASSGGSALNPHSPNIAGSSRPAIQHDTEAHQVSSPTFGFNLQAKTSDCVGDLGDTRCFGELADAIAATLHPVSISVVEKNLEPLVEEALRANDSNDEPEFIKGDSDDESGPVPTQQGGASSSGTQQYPPHLSNLNLDSLSGLGQVHGESSSDTQGSQ
ncbi:hypothetical protein PIB30_039617 [Stylosanthes scabra]|uniref:Uncharacterized protein n=1 Tax=Stylosanthes scabra TaxID=79078 RepID=A0ABU6QEZ8_9FABA|nr:hypothetical protein [Stylosanthes scabra]